MSKTVEKLEAELNSSPSAERKIDLLNALAWELRDAETIGRADAV